MATDTHTLPAAPVQEALPVPPGSPPSPTLTRPRQAARSAPFTAILLGLLALSLGAGLIIEATHGARLARELVYHTWWLTLLLGLLALRVLAAIVVRFPWQRNQAGFLIGCTGLLVFLAGGLLGGLFGSEGRLLLVDTPDAGVQKSFNVSQQAEAVPLAERHQLELFRVPAEPSPQDPVFQAMSAILDGGQDVSAEAREVLDGHYWTMNITPASLTRDGDEELPRPLRLLKAVATPWPSATLTTGDGANLKVDTFYPHTEQWPYAKARDEDLAFSALRLRLTTGNVGPCDRWLTSQPSRSPERGALALELMELEEPALVTEFTHPPSPATLGKEGVLVLAVGRRGLVCRLAVDALKPGVPVELSGTPLQLTLKRTGDLMDLLKHKDGPLSDRQRSVAYPAVHFELTGPRGKGEYLACSRLPQMPAHLRGEYVARVAAWYHAPDSRRAESKEAALHFLHGPDGTLYWRAWSKDGVTQPGQQIDVTGPETAHAVSCGQVEATFQVTAWLPRASHQLGVTPVRVEHDAQPAEGLEPAVGCTLTVAERGEEVRVRMSSRPARVKVGDALYFVRYRRATTPLGSVLTLKEARPTEGAGESDVTVASAGDGKQDVADHTVASGRTLACGSFTLSQASCRPLLDPRTQEPVVDSRGHAVRVADLVAIHDPGLPFQYAGAGLLLLGAFLMAWNRAFARPTLALQAGKV